MLTINTNKDLKNKEIIITKFKESIYNTKILNKNFVIEPIIAFSNSSAFFQKLYKIRINIDLSKTDHYIFKSLLNSIYEKLSMELEKDNGIVASKIINPVIKSNTLKNTEIIHLYINKSTEIIEYETNNVLDINSLINKRFEIYPVLNCPVLNIKDDNIYVNYYLKIGYIKFSNNDFKKEKFQVNKNNLDKAFSN